MQISPNVLDSEPSDESISASIIILTKNAGENLSRLLGRVFSQEFDGRYEVLLIDSGSTDDTLKIAADFPVIVTEIEPEEFHHGRTRNLGASLSRGRILVFVTQDALPADEHWLHTLTSGFKEPKVAIVVGRQIAWQTTKPPERFFYVYNFPAFKIVVTNGASDYYRDNVFVSNVNSAVRRDVWQEFRFSESVLMSEDKELAKRVLLAGWTVVYEPDAVVYHAHNAGLQAIFRRSAEYGVSSRQGAAGLPKSRGLLATKVLNHVTEEWKYLYRNRELKWLPYCLAYDFSVYLGSFLGQVGLAKPNVRQ